MGFAAPNVNGFGCFGNARPACIAVFPSAVNMP
jgi:hypothetical protein